MHFVAALYTLTSLTIMRGTVRSLRSADINEMRIFSINFHKMFPTQNFMAIHPVGAALTHADGRSLQTLCKTTRSRLPIALLYMHHNVDTLGCY
jgi:hypothetical protein